MAVTEIDRQTGTRADASIRSMAAYYAARAAEYEQVYAKPERQADLRRLEAWLPSCFTCRRVLEVAAGTGWWTQHGAPSAACWLATDLNPATLALARTKPAMPAAVRFAVADAYSLAELGSHRFDAALVGFWWSHVPKSRLAGWLDALHARLEPGARVVVLDNRYVEGSSTPIATIDAEGNAWQQRRLADGSQHRVMKNHPTHAEVAAVLGSRARALQWHDDRLGLTYYWALGYEVVR